MACLSRIVRFSQLKPKLTIFSRYLTASKAPSLQAVPQVAFIQNPWIWQKNEQIKLPVINKIQIDLPNGLKWVPPLEEPEGKEEAMELPTTISSEISKEAVRLIVIRRKKMKRHKLKKLRKRMKYEWAKVRQRREMKKEKAFQAMLIKQCKEAEAFSAERYVEERIAKFNELNTPVVQERKTRPKMVWPPPKQ